MLGEFLSLFFGFFFVLGVGYLAISYLANLCVSLAANTSIRKTNPLFRQEPPASLNSKLIRFYCESPRKGSRVDRRA